jgi:hypothetical protein
MPGRIVDIAPGLKAHIIGEHPLDKYDPKQLAIQLASHLQGINNFSQDARSYAERSALEKKQATELRELLEKMAEYKENGIEPKSRMDPMRTYDEMAIKTQIANHERNAAKFEMDAHDFTAKAEAEQRKANEVQTLIQKVNKHLQTAAVVEGKD